MKSTLTLTERKRNNKRAERKRKKKMLEAEGYKSAEKLVSDILSMDEGKRKLVFMILRDGVVSKKDIIQAR